MFLHFQTLYCSFQCVCLANPVCGWSFTTRSFAQLQNSSILSVFHVDGVPRCVGLTIFCKLLIFCKSLI